MRHGLARLLLATIILTMILLLGWLLSPEQGSAGPGPAQVAAGPTPLKAERPRKPAWPPFGIPLKSSDVLEGGEKSEPGDSPPSVRPPAPKLSAADDRQILEAAKVPTDGPGLLEFFRGRTLSPEERVTINALVRRLGDRAFPVRRKTSAELIEIGAKAVPLLQLAVNDRDPELQRRAEECLLQIGLTDHSPAVISSAARLVAIQKPADSAAVLLAYLPFATSMSVDAEVRNALAAVVVREGKPEAVVVEALESLEPVERGAAAEALCRAGVREELPKVRKLLHDQEKTVRLQTALALVVLQEKEAVPVLIEMLDQVPVAQAWQAEDMLCRIADGQVAPGVPLGRTAETQQKCREAWAAWWKDHGDKADLARLVGKPRLLGYTMLVLLEAGKVQEVDADGKVLWSVEGLSWPLDAQLLPGDRVLVAEGQGNRVTERNFKGEILWEKEIDNPLVAQRLPNGNTFMANMTQVIEVDRNGKEVFNHSVPGAPIRKATKLPNGDFACILSNRRFVRFDSTGKELSGFPALMQHYGGRLEMLPNGNVLVPQYHINKVIEYDPEGKIVWEAMADRPIAAVRLPNGNTLISFMNEMRVVELDREGKEVWEHKTDTRATRAWRR